MRPEPRSKPWAGIIVGVGLLLLLPTMCLAIVIPNFLHFGHKAPLSEAKTNLKAAFIAQRAFFAEHDVYGETVEAIGFLPERGNRYLYLVTNTGTPLVPGSPDGGTHTGVFADEARRPELDNRLLLAGIPTSLLSAVGVQCVDDGGCEVTMVAAGNLDADATVDVWSISTGERRFGADVNPPGVPYQHVNDLEK